MRILSLAEPHTHAHVVLLPPDESEVQQCVCTQYTVWSRGQEEVLYSWRGIRMGRGREREHNWLMGEEATVAQGTTSLHALCVCTCGLTASVMPERESVCYVLHMANGKLVREATFCITCIALWSCFSLALSLLYLTSDLRGGGPPLFSLEAIFCLAAKENKDCLRFSPFGSCGCCHFLMKKPLNRSPIKRVCTFRIYSWFVVHSFNVPQVPVFPSLKQSL